MQDIATRYSHWKGGGVVLETAKASSPSQEFTVSMAPRIRYTDKWEHHAIIWIFFFPIGHNLSVLLSCDLLAVATPWQHYYICLQGSEKSSPDTLDTLLQKMESFRAQATLPDRSAIRLVQLLGNTGRYQFATLFGVYNHPVVLFTLVMINLQCTYCFFRIFIDCKSILIQVFVNLAS